MAIIQRDDGVQLVLRCYRETLSLSNTTLFRQHAFLISEMHGYFVKFFSRSSKLIESVFSTDAGYVLAEMVWANFGKPANMIFCEALDDQNFICITARDGIIFSDGQFTAEELREELASFISIQNNVDVYLYGATPGFYDATTESSSAFKQNFKSITRLEKSLINTINVTPEFELTPLQQAISDLQLSKASQRKAFWLIIFVAAIIIGIASFVVYEMGQEKTIQQVDPFEGFKTALLSPLPRVEIQQTVAEVLRISAIPGWQLTNIEVKNNLLVASMSSFGGSATNLLSWAKTNKATVNFTQASTQLTMPLGAIPNRVPPANPIPINQTIANIVDNLMKITPERALVLGNISPKGVYSTLSATIQFHRLTPSLISLIGDTINTLPVTVDSITLSQADNLIDGDIKLTVYGN